MKPSRPNSKSSPPLHSSFRLRLRGIFVFILVGLAAVLGRLAWLQVVSPDSSLPEKSRRRQFFSASVEPFRGDIVARCGTRLATDALTFDVMVPYRHLAASPPRWLASGAAGAERLGVEADVAGPFRAERVPLWAARLALVAEADVDEIMERRHAITERVGRIRASVLQRNPALRRIRNFRVVEETVPHVILQDVPFEVAAKVEARHEWFPEVSVAMKRRRAYPLGRVACHLVGGLSEVAEGREPSPPPGEEVHPDKAYRPGDEYGVQGIEKTYDWQLRGTRGERWYQRRPRPLPDKLDRVRPAQPGRTVELALHLPAQREAERALGGGAGAVFVMDAHTGEALVCASAPGYDLNLAGAELAALFGISPGPFLNRAIQDPVPGGSVVKVATAVAGARVGVFQAGTSLHCDRVFRIGRWSFTCPVPHGRVDLARSLEVSCNVYYFANAQSIGPEALAEWSGKLGLGRRTGIDLPYEASGRFPTPAWMRSNQGRAWYPGDTLNVSIGQGDMQSTPAQVAVMMAAVANGGRVLRPRMVLRILDREGRETPLPDGNAPPAQTLDLHGPEMEAIRRGMRDVSLTGTARRVGGLAALGVAGKSGTAQTGRERTYHAWFAGFAPFDRPRYAFAVVLHNTSQGGGEAAAPVARDVLQALFDNPDP